jgi:hypothetical protein
VLRPSIPTLNILATALSRDGQLLLVAADRLDPLDPIAAAAWLLGLMGGPQLDVESDDELAAAAVILEQRKDELKRLAIEGARLEPADLNALTARDHSRRERSKAFGTATREAELAHQSTERTDREEHTALARASLERVQMLDRELDERDRALDEVRLQVRERHALHSDARAELQAALRHYAAVLFLRLDNGTFLPPLNSLGLRQASEAASVALKNQANVSREVRLRSLSDQTRILNQVVSDERARLTLLRESREDPELRRVSIAWEQLSPDRRRKVRDFVEDQLQLSLHDQLRTLATEEVNEGNRNRGQTEATDNN